MPAIWSSSERPISVRTVWVDGIRHAILTPDDPLLDLKTRRRPQTTPTKPKNFSAKHVCRESLHRPTESLDSCLVKFHVLSDRRDPDSLSDTKITRRQSAPISRTLDAPKNLLDLPLNGLLNVPRNSCDSLINDEKNKLRCSSFQELPSTLRKNSSIKSNDSEDNEIRGNIIKSVVTFSEDCVDNKTRELNNNPLSERVLQWMDMSGRVKDYRNNTEEQRRNINYKSNTPIPRECTLRRRNSASVSQELVQYKLSSNHHSECELIDEKIESKYYSETPRNIITAIQEDIIEPEVIVASDKSVWSPFGRPQLHIFMPDLSSSEEDTSSQDSLTVNDSLE